MRYAEQLAPADPPESARQMVTCGLGGAYLDTTHELAKELTLLPQLSRNWREGDDEAKFVQQPVTFPSIEESRGWVSRLALPWRPEWIVRRNPGVFTVFAIAQFTFFLILLLIFWQGIQAKNTGRIIDAYISASPETLIRFTGGLLAVVLLGFVICLLPMVRRRPPLLPVKAMALILSQLGTACACFVGFGLLPAGLFGGLTAWLKFFIVIVGVSAVGGVVGAFFLGVWIVVYMSQGLTAWAMMGQAIEEGKGFLRIKLSPDGVLTLYPIVTDELVRDYEVSDKQVLTSSGRFTKIPVPTGPLPKPRLIEQPFRILPTRRALAHCLFGGSDRAYAVPRSTQARRASSSSTVSASTRSQPRMPLPRISNSCAPGSCSSASVSSGSQRSISPPCPLAATARWPPIRKARPPNIFISVRPCSPATSTRIRSARSSSYAMASCWRTAPHLPGSGEPGTVRGGETVPGSPLGGVPRCDRSC